MGVNTPAAFAKPENDDGDGTASDAMFRTRAVSIGIALELRLMGGRARPQPLATVTLPLPLRDRARAMPGCEMVPLRAKVGLASGSAPAVGLRPSSDRRADGAGRGGDERDRSPPPSRRTITVSVRPCSASRPAMPSSSALQ